MMDSITLAPATGLLLGGGIAAGFVAAMYIPKEARQSNYRRDLKENIQKRILCSGCTCVAALAAIIAVRPAGEATILQRCGLQSSPLGAAVGIGMTACLFAGVIRDRIATGDLGSALDAPEGLRAAVLPSSDKGFQFFRNYIFAPLSEEFVFRVCLVHMLRAGGWSMPATWLTGVGLFAAAHTHHVYFFVTSLNYQFGTAALILAANFLVHSVFALYSLNLYTLTGSMLCSGVAHSICNALGPPSLRYLQCEEYTTAEKVQISLGHILGIAGFFWGTTQVAALFPTNHLMQGP